jgi:hypothetical protein
VGHLLWVLGQIHEVLPLLAARFSGASMAQKYDGLLGESRDAFVLGGNPLRAAHRAGGEAAVDAWLAEQAVWSDREVAQMLRELAVDIVTGGDDPPPAEPARAAGAPERRARRATAVAPARGLQAIAAPATARAIGSNGLDDDRGRYIATYAGDVLIARARAGQLDPRAADALRPLLATPEPYVHRKAAAAGILGALRDRASVPALIQVLADHPLRSEIDAIGKDDLLVEAAAALGAIGDASALDALAALACAPGAHYDRPRPVAAIALAACAGAAAGAPAVPAARIEAVIDALLAAIREREDGEHEADLHLAIGHVARVVPPQQRAGLRARIAATLPSRSDAPAMLARRAALVLASADLDDAVAAWTEPAGAPSDAGPEAAGGPESIAALAAALRAALAARRGAHDAQVRALGIALGVAELLPQLADVGALVALTRFADPQLRRRATQVLAGLGHEVALLAGAAKTPSARAPEPRAARAGTAGEDDVN